MNKIDMHFHTTLSDWKFTNEQVIDEAKGKWLEFIVATEYDIINTELVNLATKKGIKSIEWVEISSHDDKILKKSLHLTCYANQFSGQIIDILDKSRNGRIEKIKTQIRVLNSNWFNLNYDDFIAYFTSKWFRVDNLNNAHIDEFFFLLYENRKLLSEITGQEIWSPEFIWKCLIPNWEFSHLWWWAVDKYEPTVTEIWNISKESWYFLSLAHPNFTFQEDFDLFKKFIEEYKWVFNWIEINSLASKEWVQTILETSKKYNMILTFWSDDHFVRDRIDLKHWKFWELNPHMSEWQITRQFKYFCFMMSALETLKKSWNY